MRVGQPPLQFHAARGQLRLSLFGRRDRSVERFEAGSAFALFFLLYGHALLHVQEFVQPAAQGGQIVDPPGRRGQRRGVDGRRLLPEVGEPRSGAVHAPFGLLAGVQIGEEGAGGFVQGELLPEPADLLRAPGQKRLPAQ